MKNPKSLLFVGFLFYASKVCLCGAGFELPAGTPGRQETTDMFGQIWPDTSYQGNKFCEHVIIPNTNCHLYFPTDGSQSDTPQAGQWSGAGYVGMLNDDLVTDWWIRVFGGNRAVDASNGLPRGGGCNIAGFFFLNFFGNLWNNVLPKNRVPAHIITVNANVQGTPQSFEGLFWQAFREIADDPVGRVLLYRLLIEIRRVDDAGNGCCGDDVILPMGYDPDERNNCRGIEIINSNDGCAFDFMRCLIEFDLDRGIQTGTLILDPNNNLTTQEENRPCTIALFHEMLHWFHFLRHPSRFDRMGSENPCQFKYPLRCYYGNVGELNVWGGIIDAEEIATILGSPDLNLRNINALNLLALIPHKAFSLRKTAVNNIQVNINGVDQYIPISEQYLNGDDLSENAYRASQGQHMRFGHMTAAIEPVPLNPIPERFRLAHGIAVQCYQDITGNAPQNWQLIPGQAIQP